MFWQRSVVFFRVFLFAMQCGNVSMAALGGAAATCKRCETAGNLCPRQPRKKKKEYIKMLISVSFLRIVIIILWQSISYQFGELRETSGHLGYVLELDEILGCEDVDDPVAADLANDRLHAVLHWVLSKDQITIKTPNPKFRLYWCLIEFNRLDTQSVMLVFSKSTPLVNYL